MPKSADRSRASATAPCGCRRCTFAATPACRCHVFNALVAFTLWDLSRALRARTP